MDSSKKRPLIDPTSPAGVGIKKVAKALGKIPDSYEIPDKEDPGIQDLILLVLTRLPNEKKSLEFGEIAEKTNMTDKKAGLNYHLKALLKISAIKKEEVGGKNPVYSRSDDDALTKIEAVILDTLSSNNYYSQSVSQLEGAICSSGKFDVKTLTVALDNLVKRHRIEMYNDQYAIPFWELPDSVCHHCRQVFKDDELVISQIMTNPVEDLEQFPIHATCRHQMRDPSMPWNVKNVSCDYCGLELSLRHLISHIQNKYANQIHDQTMIHSAVGTLFDEPYSKIISYINGEDEFIDYRSQEDNAENIDWVSSREFNKSYENLADSEKATVNAIIADQRRKNKFGTEFMNQGYAYFVRKNGKQYHPYCAKQVK